MRGPFLALAAIIPLLGACTAVQDSLRPGEIATLERDWMKTEIVQRPPALYCYRTLGREDCYRTPIEGQGKQRLIEHYGPPPEVLSY
jgi:hypothetical protein